MKTQDYSILWQRIHKKAKEKRILFRVMFELTYGCNFYCRHCYVPQGYRKRKGELKRKEIFSILEQLKDIGCFYLGFTGGEPFIREDIMDILWYAKRKGFEIIIYTNGSLIDEKIADELVALRPNKVDITIPAMSKTAFERISGVCGSRDKVLRGIELLYKNRVNLGFKTCVLKENKSELGDIRKFAQSLGALHRLDDMLSPCLDGSKEPYKYRGQRTKQKTCSDSKVASDCNFHIDNRKPITDNQKSSTNNLFKCGVGLMQAAITPFGELKMCPMINYPKYEILNTESRAQKINLKDAWERLKELVASIKRDENYQCDRCELEPYCKWCPAKAWLYNGSFTSCDLESHTWAELRRQNSESNLRNLT